MAARGGGGGRLARAARARKAAVRRALLGWFRREARPLPWRRTRDPYRIWLSEILLQQTRIEAAIPYYERFLAAFPTVRDLAEAGEDRVLKLWEGLGYYRRARHLHRAARAVVARRRGRLPRTAAGWRELPGVGPYTAGAIASIAFGEAVAAVDGNVARVLARVFDVGDPVEEAATRRALWDAAGILVAPRTPGAFNQALMELGGRICTPRRPRCEACPLARWCDARGRGRQEARPVRRPRRRAPHREIVAGAIRRNGRYLLGKRPAGGLLGGLWELPAGAIEAGESHAEALARIARADLGLRVRVGAHLASVDHAYSHLTETLHLYRCDVEGGRTRATAHARLVWVPRGHLGRYALPAVQRKVLDRL